MNLLPDPKLLPSDRLLPNSIQDGSGDGNSSALIAFDTTPPDVDIERPIFISNGVYEVSYTVTEPAAILASTDVVEVVVQVEPDKFILSNVPSETSSLELTVEATDNVNNQSIEIFFISLAVRDFEYPLGFELYDVTSDIKFEDVIGDFVLDDVQTDMVIAAAEEIDFTIEDVNAELIMDDADAELQIDDATTEFNVESVDTGFNFEEYVPPSEEG